MGSDFGHKGTIKTNIIAFHELKKFRRKITISQ